MFFLIARHRISCFARPAILPSLFLRRIPRDFGSALRKPRQKSLAQMARKVSHGLGTLTSYSSSRRTVFPTLRYGENFSMIGTDAENSSCRSMGTLAEPWQHCHSVPL